MIKNLVWAIVKLSPGLLADKNPTKTLKTLDILAIFPEENIVLVF
jgi:hypothetical protein